MGDANPSKLAPEERHERTDARLAVAIWFGIGVAVLIVAALVGMFAVFGSFEQRSEERDKQRTISRGAPEPGQQDRPPWPGEQLELLRQYEQDALESYGWVDQEKGRARIPVDKAMEIIVERSRQGGTGGAR